MLSVTILHMNHRRILRSLTVGSGQFAVGAKVNKNSNWLEGLQIIPFSFERRESLKNKSLNLKSEIPA
jgi:hypothetical protein